MTKLTRPEIKDFLLNKVGYIKKSPIKTAEAIWKTQSKQHLPKSRLEVQEEIKLIKEVQSKIRSTYKSSLSVDKTGLIDTYNKIRDEIARPKRRLFFDIEVSSNIVMSWRIGNRVNIGYDSIIKERAIICVCWKWQGENKVHSLQWKNGDDKELVAKFAKVLESADEVIGQNSDRFDIRWLRTRAIFHGIPMVAKLNSLDTLKFARAGFMFNCNKLDYMGEFLGQGKKIKTDYDLWKSIMFDNDKEAMKKMVNYCKQDVNLLEKVYDKLSLYVPEKKFKIKVK